MPAYIKRESTTLSVDDIPYWFQTYLRFLRAIRGFTLETQLTHYNVLKEYGRFLHFPAVYRHEIDPSHTNPDYNGLSDMDLFRDLTIIDLSLDNVARCTKRDLENYQYFLSEILGNTGTTLNKKVSIIKTFYDYLVDEQASFSESEFQGKDLIFRQVNCLHVTLSGSPASRLHNSKVIERSPTSLSPTDVCRLLDAISGSENEHRDYFLILLAVSTGMRVSEICKLNIDDFGENDVLIRGKGNRERRVPLTEPCKEAMQEYLDLYRTPIALKLKNENAMFVSRRQFNRIVPRTVQAMVTKYAALAGMRTFQIHPHTFRHTAATIMVNEGVDLLTVQRFLGHVSPQTTSRYTHLSGQVVHDAVSRSTLSKFGRKVDFDHDEE